MAKKCTREESHHLHLCELVAKSAPLEELKELVKDGQYICEYCGRVAASDERPCAPTKL